MFLDNYIPFIEVFIIPYLLWFPYIILTFVLLAFLNKEDYKKACYFLFTRMTIFLIISIIWPNGHLLRPRFFEDNNIFTEMVKKLYLIDTSTNVVPSIHVFNSIGAHIALSKNERIKKHKGFMNCSLVLCILIILSTVFLKQHSTLDVFTGFILAAILYPFVYEFNYSNIHSTLQEKCILAKSKRKEKQYTN